MGQWPQEYIPNCHNPAEAGMGQRPQEYMPNYHNPVDAGIGQPGTNTINHLRKHHGIDREAIRYTHLPQGESPFPGTLTFTNGPSNTYQPATTQRRQEWDSSPRNTYQTATTQRRQKWDSGPRNTYQTTTTQWRQESASQAPIQSITSANTTELIGRQYVTPICHRVNLLFQVR